MTVIKGVVFGEVRARLGQTFDCGEKRIVCHRRLDRFNFDLHALRKFCPGGENDDAILDCSDNTHCYFLPPPDRKGN